MSIGDKTLIGALQELADRLRGLPSVLAEASADSREEILVRYVLGTGRFSKDGRFINIDCKAYKLNGEDDGTYIGVDAPLFQGQELVAKILQRPKQPDGPFDTPEGQYVEHVMPLSYSKGLRTFPDGSTLTAIGPANLHATVYVDGASQFWVTSNLIVVEGSGRYKGARGLKTVAGSTWVQPGKSLTDLTDFSVKTVEVYRVIRSKDLGKFS